MLQMHVSSCLMLFSRILCWINLFEQVQVHQESKTLTIIFFFIVVIIFHVLRSLLFIHQLCTLFFDYNLTILCSSCAIYQKQVQIVTLYLLVCMCISGTFHSRFIFPSLCVQPVQMINQTFLFSLSCTFYFFLMFQFLEFIRLFIEFNLIY